MCRQRRLLTSGDRSSAVSSESCWYHERRISPRLAAFSASPGDAVCGSPSVSCIREAPRHQLEERLRRAAVATHLAATLPAPLLVWSSLGHGDHGGDPSRLDGVRCAAPTATRHAPQERCARWLLDRPACHRDHAGACVLHVATGEWAPSRHAHSEAAIAARLRRGVESLVPVCVVFAALAWRGLCRAGAPVRRPPHPQC